MKKKYKLSFLMAAHNEEKIIGFALNRLLKVYEDYPNMEVLIGLDGCTDGTLEIVKKFVKRNKFIRYFELNERKGKQAVLEKLEPTAKGDIILVHDADWSFVYESKKDLLDYLSLFDKPNIGGVADSFSSEKMRPDFDKIKSIGFLASAWGNYFLIDYVKTQFTIDKKGIKVYDREKMKFCPFLDVYRREVMKNTKHDENLRAGDHIERTLRIIDAGYDVVAFFNPSWPHYLVNYNELSMKDFIKQKIRGIIAKSKIKRAYEFKIPFFGFYVPFLFYLIGKSFEMKRFKDFFAIYVYLFVMFYSILAGKFKEKMSVKEVWNLRTKR